MTPQLPFLHPPEGDRGFVDRAQVAAGHTKREAPIEILQLNQPLDDLGLRAGAVQDAIHPGFFQVRTFYVDIRYRLANTHHQSSVPVHISAGSSSMWASHILGERFNKEPACLLYTHPTCGSSKMTPAHKIFHD